MRPIVARRRQVAFAVALAAGLAAASLAAAAEAKRAPGSADEVKLSFAPVVKRAGPAVVNIYTRRVVRERPASPFFDDPFFRRFFGEGFPGVGPRERILRSLGSGVILRPEGVIVTNHHVIAGAEQITVVLADRREFDAKVVLSDKRTDLAVLRIDPGRERLATIELRDSDELEVGDLLLAIGNPFGVGQTVTSGIVSALARTSVGITDFRSFIQTDAAINPGNSGGALVTTDGRLVGINTAIFSRSGGSIGLGFAIPSNMVRVVLDAALAGRKLVRPWLGASGQDVTADIAASLGLRRVGGVILKEVGAGGPAERAGIRVGDIIVAVNGREVIDGEGLRFRIATLSIGAVADFTIVRGGRRRTLRVTLAAPPEDPPRRVSKLRGPHPLSGATVANLSPALNEELGVSTGLTGVIVLDVAQGTTAAYVKLRKGDILLSINDREVRRVAGLKRILSARPRTWRISLRRGGQVINFTVRA